MPLLQSPASNPTPTVLSPSIDGEARAHEAEVPGCERLELALLLMLCVLLLMLTLTLYPARTSEEATSRTDPALMMLFAWPCLPPRHLLLAKKDTFSWSPLLSGEGPCAPLSLF